MTDSDRKVAKSHKSRKYVFYGNIIVININLTIVILEDKYKMMTDSDRKVAKLAKLANPDL